MTTPSLPLPPIDPSTTTQGNIGPGIPQNIGEPADPGNINAPDTGIQIPQSNVVNTDPNTGVEYIQVIVNGKPISIALNTNLHSYDSVLATPRPQVKGEIGGTLAKGASAAATKQSENTVQNQIASIGSWWKDQAERQAIINQMYQAGLITSKKSISAEEAALAWATVVQETALENQNAKPGSGITPQELLAKAAQQGWNSINPTLSPADTGARGTGNLNNSTDTNTQAQTIYKSYVDPATAMGTYADAKYRLDGRNPTSAEYQAFLNDVYNYQEAENTGKFETQNKGPIAGQIDPSTGQPVDSTGAVGGTSTQTNVVSQRGIGTRGLQYLAGQAALSDPEEGAYQAATTYFNALIKSLQEPAAGMQAAGPTTTIP